jgi:arylsulfatase A-like enzyme
VPHVVLIVVDTLRADYVGSYGSEVSTPNIDRLAAAGVRFANAYCHVPITGPSHASLFTSLLPFEHGVVNNAQIFDLGFETFAEVLRFGGRRTAGFVSLGVLKRQFRFDQGFEQYFDSFERDWMKDARELNHEVLGWLDGVNDAPLFSWIHYSDPHEPYTPPGLEYPGVGVRLGGGEQVVIRADGRGHEVTLVVPPGTHTVRLEGVPSAPRHTIRFPFLRVEDPRLELIRGRGWKTKLKRFGDPAFDTTLPATLEIVNPTSEPRRTVLQLMCRELLSVPEIRERYALEVEFVDEQIGVLLDELERRGVLDDALVIFTSDHGEAFGEHNHVGHISQLYEELIRVPLIVSFPGRLQAGRVVEQSVGLIDLLPTVAELLDLELRDGGRGRSLVPLLDGNSLPDMPVVAETYRPEAASDKKAVVFGGIKYIHSWSDREWEEIYDLRTDPGERNDLATTRPDLLAQLRTLLERQLATGARVPSRDAALTDEEKERLRALGYIR